MSVARLELRWPFGLLEWLLRKHSASPAFDLPVHPNRKVSARGNEPDLLRQLGYRPSAKRADVTMGTRTVMSIAHRAA